VFIRVENVEMLYMVWLASVGCELALGRRFHALAPSI